MFARGVLAWPTRARVEAIVGLVRVTGAHVAPYLPIIIPAVGAFTVTGTGYLTVTLWSEDPDLVFLRDREPAAGGPP